MTAIRGYPSQQKLERTNIQFVTVEPVRKDQNGLSVTAHQYVFEVGTDAAESGSSISKIVATAHAALEGDIIRFTSGAHSAKEYKVFSVTANDINLVEDLSTAVGIGDTFQILRHKYPLVEPTGEVKVTGAFSFNEQAVAADGGALPAQVKVAGGYDGSNVQVLKTDANGELQVDVLSSALPSGAATETTLATLATEATLSGAAADIAAIESTVATLATEATASVIAADVSTLAGAVSGTEVQADIKKIEGVIDTANGSTTALGVGGNFTGAWTQITDYASIQVGVFADQNSATDGFKVEFSEDGVGIHHTHSFSYLAASNGIGYLFQPEFKYFRVNYTNGAAAQTSFKLISTLRAVQIPQSLYPANYIFTGQSQVTLTKGVIVGETTAGGGAYVPVKVNPSGALTVDADVTASVLPTGAATESTLSAISGKLPAVLGQDTMADSLAVVIASDQSAIPVTQSGTWNITNVSGTVSLPTGAATESTLSTLNGKVTACDTGNVTIASSALPTGAATETTLAAVKTAVELIDNAVSGNELQVDVVAALPAGTNTIGKVDVNTLSVVDLLDAGILDTSSSNIAGSASAPTQVVATLAAAVKKIQLLDTTGAFIGLYTGGSGSEVLQLVIGPGSDQTIEHAISAGTRVSLKRLDSTTAISSGIVAINFIG